jgi:hypothetical protein
MSPGAFEEERLAYNREMLTPFLLACTLLVGAQSSPAATTTANDLTVVVPHGDIPGRASPATVAVNPAVPEWLSKKRPLAPFQLTRKEEGVYLTGLPLVNYDPDKGLGYGARLYLFDNGSRSDPLFKFSPYFHRVYFQFFRTTAGFQSHAIKWDAPYIGGSPYRIRSALAYERDTDVNYFGTGEDAMAPLKRDDQRRTFSSIEDYEEVNQRILNGRTFAKYNKVDFLRPRWNIHLEREIFGGLIRPLIGFQVAKATVRDYSGSRVTVDGEEAISNRTKLAEDAAANDVVGFDGGWNNTAKLGVAYDTRDFEPNPSAGMFHDFSFEFARRAIGSAYDFERYNATVRFYYTPISEATLLTLAARGMYQVQTGEVPFFEMGTLSFTQGNDIGLGGLRTIRGYQELRFIGPVAALANLEARWQFFEHRFAGQRFAYMLAPFVDSGRVFDKAAEASLQDWRTGYGAGLRAIWNLATILSIDYGRGAEGDGIYVNFQLMF